MKSPKQSLTSLPQSPDDERRKRMIKYLIVMGVRLACLVLVLFVHVWWAVVLLAIGAILLPYFAVVLANVGTSWVSRAERPTAIEVYRNPIPPQGVGTEAPGAGASEPHASGTSGGPEPRS
ncbi:DUF3099 domain-containing protein [Herbiconiux sp. 11R-BC]|uniref:DUF3099 domain-containing protein n=1 Tax=Herbiconiux sp. 11R-BC TaxID=3111637 RepID=UPI003C10AEB5